MDSLLTKKEKFTRQRIIWKFSGKRVLCLVSRLCTIYMYIVHSLWSCQILIWYKWNRPGCYNTIIEYLEWVIIPRLKLTRMHSSRMYRLHVDRMPESASQRGVLSPRGMYLVPGGVLSPTGCTWSWGEGVYLVPGGCLLKGGAWSRGVVCSRGVSAQGGMSAPWRGVPGPRGVSVCSGRVSATGEVYLVPGGVCSRGLLVRYPPCEQNEWQTRVKT